MKPISTVIVALIALLMGTPSAGAQPALQPRPDLQRLFAQEGTRGTMVVQQRGPTSRTVVVGDRRSRKRYLPSSTFKVPNALLALDTGAVSGPAARFPGPNRNYPVDGKPFLPAACEGDLTLATAFALSCIPVFQDLARRVGRRAYRRAVRKWRYGNARVGGAPLDRFWLEGPFAISAREQVAFLQRLRTDRLAASRRALRQVRAMMVVERSGPTVLRAKTGWAFAGTPDLGWWVGWVARGRSSWTFALNLDILEPADAGARLRIGRAILTELGALPAGAS
jgi:beta-lactamase class D